MRVHGVQKRIPRETTRVPRGVIRPTVATDGIASRVPQVGIVDAELGVVEDVKRFHAKLEIAAFRDFEMLQQSDIKVQPAWVVHEIASGISES